MATARSACPTIKFSVVCLAGASGRIAVAAAGADFSRCAFQLDTAALPGFSELVPLSLSGVGLLAADPGSDLMLSPRTLHLGTLSVALNGLLSGSDLSVSLAGGPPPLGT